MPPMLLPVLFLLQACQKAPSNTSCPHEQYHAVRQPGASFSFLQDRKAPCPRTVLPTSHPWFPRNPPHFPRSFPFHQAPAPAHASPSQDLLRTYRSESHLLPMPLHRFLRRIRLPCPVLPLHPPAFPRFRFSLCRAQPAPQLPGFLFFSGQRVPSVPREEAQLRFPLHHTHCSFLNA